MVFSQQIHLEIMVPVVKALPATMEGFLEAPESAQQARDSMYYNFFIQTVIFKCTILTGTHFYYDLFNFQEAEIPTGHHVLTSTHI